MRYLTAIAAGFAVICCGDSSAQAQTDHSYPMLLSVHPPAIQVGTSSDVRITSWYHQREAYQVIVTGNGLRGEPLPLSPLKAGETLPPNKRRKFDRTYHFTADASALPGVRDYRIATDQGVSTLGQILLTRDPVVLEKDSPANDSAENAQPIQWPATVCGTLERAEDVDYFRFQAAAGQRLVLCVRAAALQNKLHDFEGFIDPQLTLYDAAGNILATANNSFGSDPVLAHAFTFDGEYRVQLRDVRYKGNPEWVYALEIHDRPFVTQVFPSAVQAGTKSTLTAVGHNLAATQKLEIAPTAGSDSSIQQMSSKLDGRPTNEFPVLVTPKSVTLETTTSQDAAQGGQSVTIPSLICGRIEAADQVDRYSFTARRGDRFTIEAFARRCRSRLDTLLRIVNEQGQVLIENDDQASLNRKTSDSQIENWSAPADGRYTLEIRDLNGRGGPEFVYALDFARSRPNFRLELESDKSHLSPGLSYPIYVHADRRAGFSNAIQLAVSDLPAGVSAEAGIIPAGAKHACIILTAADSAPRGVGTVRVTGTAIPNPTEKNSTANFDPQPVTATPLGDIRTAGRPLFVKVSSHAVSVGPPQNIRSLNVSTRELQLKPGETRVVDITIERAPQYTGLVRLESYVHYFEETHATSLPPGVTLDLEKSKAILNTAETRGTLVFHADANAKPSDRHLVPVMSQVAMSLSIRFNYCQPLWLSVVKP